jgi:vacuolar-type H+-ATPase subunit H
MILQPNCYHLFMRKLLLSTLLVGLFSACSAKVDEDGAEVKVDGDTKESVQDAWNDASREIEKGAEKAKEKLEDAGDALKEKTEEVREKVSDDDPKIEVEVKKD